MDEIKKVYLLDGRNCTVHVMTAAAAADADYEIGTVWASGSTYNNRPAALNMLTGSLSELDEHLQDVGYPENMRNSLMDLLGDAQPGNAFGTDGDPA